MRAFPPTLRLNDKIYSKEKCLKSDQSACSLYDGVAMARDRVRNVCVLLTLRSSYPINAIIDGNVGLDNWGETVNKHASMLRNSLLDRSEYSTITI